MSVTWLTRDDRTDYWTCRSDAGVAVLCELETLERVGIPWSDPDWPPVFGEVQAGYRVQGRAVAAAYTTGGEENFGTLGIAADLDRRYRRRRAQAIASRGRNAETIRRRHPDHHCGRGRCPYLQEA
jgi:hypothetical protein